MIALTQIDGRCLYFNPAHIAVLVPTFYKKNLAVTEVHVGPGADDFFLVLECPNTILVLLNNAKS